MEKELFKRLILEYQQLVINVELTPCDVTLSDNFNYVLPCRKVDGLCKLARRYNINRMLS